MTAIQKKPGHCSPHAPVGDLRYLSRSDVERLGISLTEVFDVVHRVMIEKGRGETESPPKRGIVPTPTSHLRAMKAFIPSMGAAGVKWISAFSENAERGLPTITGLVVLNDLETGVPRAVMDCTWITAARTAACTAVSAHYLARPDSTTIGIVACGVQGRANLEALCARYDVSHVAAYDLRPEAARGFADEMATRFAIEVEPVDRIDDAVRDRDIVVTSLPGVKNPQPPIDLGVLSPGGFACLLDFDSAFTGRAMREVDQLVTDDRTQLDFFKTLGYFLETPEPDGDLGKIAAGRQRGRESDTWRTMAINMGIGVLDIALASMIHERAVESGIGAHLTL
ncbi:MAG: ornithine cyclodeaminase family protein [Planctomycetota bacterium]|jgi:ornithine cyclodeaminase/alanine dehydrogenase